jgi:hypothetical protein
MPAARAPIVEDQERPRGGDHPQTHDPQEQGRMRNDGPFHRRENGGIDALANTPVGMLRYST